MSDELHWHDVTLFGQTLPADKVCRGESVRFVMNNRLQYTFLAYFFPDFELHNDDQSPVWIENAGKKFFTGDSEYCTRIGSMIRNRGLMANLSLRENLLLPFLYGSDSNKLKMAEKEVDEIAEFIGLTESLHEQAGERSAFTHAMISLGHCLLQKPDVIIAQEVHVGMPPERLKLFRETAVEALERLGSGMLYLTSSVHEGSGMSFVRTHEIEDDSVPDVSGIW
ncbi:MAG: hypothetical protein R8K22_06895 [Mariprofundaceae bacterium]